MAHGGYDKRRVAGRKPATNNNHRSKSALGVEKKSKTNSGSLKRQIRSTERLLRKVQFFNLAYFSGLLFISLFFLAYFCGLWAYCDVKSNNKLISHKNKGL